MTTNKPSKRGGARPGAGPPRRIIRLDGEAARALRLLVRQRRMVAPGTTEERVVTDLIEAAAAELDREYQKERTE